MAERAHESEPAKAQRSDSEAVAHEEPHAPAAKPKEKKKQAANVKAADVAVRKIAHSEKGHNAPTEGPVRVLVTGYGAFMGIEDNPTAEIARQLAKVKIPDAIIKTEVLPVTWKDVDSFVAGELKTFKPDIVISMGFSAGHHEIKEYSVNKKSGPDASGIEGGGQKIDQNGPEFRHTTLPVDKIMNDQKKLGDKGLQTVDHTEPDDDYLCNYIEYNELKVLQNTGTEVGFLHISDVERDLPAVKQLIMTAVADIKAQRSHGHEKHANASDGAKPDEPK